MDPLEMSIFFGAESVASSGLLGPHDLYFASEGDPITLAWTLPVSPEFTAIRVEGRQGTDPFDQVAELPGNATSDDVNPGAGETWDYRVRGEIDGTYSLYSNTVTITAPE